MSQLLLSVCFLVAIKRIISLPLLTWKKGGTNIFKDVKDYNYRKHTMKYRNEEIGIPTIEMVAEYIQEKGFAISPRKVYRHYNDNRWTSAGGYSLVTLETAINGCNSQLNIYGLDSDEIPETYKQLLNTPDWRSFSKRVKAFFQNKCQKCGSLGPLHLHHKVYYTKKGRLVRKPWEYEMKDLEVLCEDCHKKAHNEVVVNRM